MTAAPIRLLFLEDNPGDARLVQVTLAEHAPGEFGVTWVERLADALARIGAERFDAILCDLGLPDSAGLASAQAIAARDPALPLVVLTGTHDKSLGREAIAHGAQDYLVKGESDGALIARTLRYAIERKRLEIGLRTANEALEHRVVERTAELESANNTLRASEMRYRALFDNMLDGFAYCRMQYDDSDRPVDFVYLAVNRAFERLTGLEHVVGRPVSEVIPGIRATSPELLEIYGRVASNGIPATFEYFFKPLAKWLSIAVYGPQKGHFAAIFDDITERKLARDELARKERYYRKLIEGGSDVFFLIDRAGKLLYRSESGKQLTGWEAEDVLGNPVTDNVSAKSLPQVRDAIAQAIAHPGQLNRVELQMLRKDGTVVEVDAMGRNLLDDPDVGGIVVTARDISERKRAEAELRRLNWALRALGQSNSALVHAGSENELFQSTCDAITGSGGYLLAWIGLARDDAAHSVEVAASAGQAIEFMREFAATWADLPDGRGPTGTAIRTGTTQVDNNLARGDAPLSWVERALAHGLAAWIALPIRANGSVIGALAVCSGELDAFDQPTAKLFEELATDISYGITSRRIRVAYEAGLVDRERATRALRAAFESLIAVLAATVERRDPYTAGHQRRVAELASAIGRALGFDAERLEGLHFAATIHDIGKIYVPAEILARPGRLGATEFELVKSHAQVGYEIIKDVEFPWQVADIIRQHHERLDGSGYPQGLKGEQILLESRILAVADVVEAMSSHRPYRPGLGLGVALAQIRKEAGTTLDAQVVEACERVFGEQGFAFEKA